MMKKNKIKLVYKIDLTILAVSLLSMIFVIGYARPLVIAPVDGLKTSDSEILFSIDKADTLFIDDNSDFTTPNVYEVKDGLEINLAPGKYFWKAKGVFESEVRTLTINSEVNFKLRKIDNSSFGVYNAGNVRLDVEVYNGTSLVEKKKIGILEEANVSGNKFIGREDE